MEQLESLVSRMQIAFVVTSVVSVKEDFGLKFVAHVNKHQSISPGFDYNRFSGNYFMGTVNN